MNAMAYCAQSVRHSVRRVAGREPITCPPATADTLAMRLLEGNGLLYLKLHGMPGHDTWYGDDGVPALREAQIRALNLAGTVVFAVNCYTPDGPMLDALLDAGARAVIAGRGPNYGKAHGVDGADLLGLYVRVFMGLGFSPQEALLIGKVRLRLKWPTAAIRDALDFELYARNDDA